MFIEHEFYVGLSDINPLKELTNTCLLRFLEDAAGIHSEIAGYGITDMNHTKRSWILLSWKIEIKKRPLVNDKLKVKTWSKKIEKFYAYRDFEVRDQYDEIVCIASSKWIFIDIEKGKIVRVPGEVSDSYKPEPDFSVFKEQELEKLEEPEEFLSETTFKITRNMIDINKHLHNIYYLDIAKEALPEEIALSSELNSFEVMYKKEIKLGDTVKVLYTKKDDIYYVVIKSEDSETTHAIIKLK